MDISEPFTGCVGVQDQEGNGTGHQCRDSQKAGYLALPGGTDSLQTQGWLTAVGISQLSALAAAFLP